MFADLLTVLWKEIRELLALNAGFRGGRYGMLIFAAVFGVLMPLQSGPAWVTSPVSLVYWAWVPFLLVSGVTADAFAGERERHTLETLLASRLPDRAILFGKIAAGIGYGWGITLACVLISLLTINIAHGQDGLLLYRASTGLGILAISFLVAALSSGLGVLVSLRAATVRQAQQTFSIAFFLLFVPAFAFPFLPPELQARLAELVMRTDPDALLGWAIALLAGVDALVMGLAMRRFQRARLILD
jgi:ABC-2 type transport system permease protein